MKHWIVCCLLLPVFFSNCKEEPDPSGPCECETDEFPYLGFHDITRLEYIDNSIFRSYDVSNDFVGSLIVEFTDSESFVIDCSISIDTLDIDFYLDGSYSFSHSCSWAKLYLGTYGDADWCRMSGTGTLDIENSTNANLLDQIINFNFQGFDASIIIPVDNNANKLKISVNSF